MAKSNYLSTGEVAGLLNISRSTVSRKFDQGMLRGRTNPITGERLISRGSLASFIKQHQLPINDDRLERKSILQVTADKNLQNLLASVLSVDPRLAVEKVEYGCDALMAISSSLHDLMIIDEDLPDIACQEIIKSLHRTRNRTTPNILCCSTRSGEETCLSWGATKSMVKAYVKESTLKETIYSLLELAEEPEPQNTTFEHHRRWPRFQVNLPANLTLYRIGSPRQRHYGNAVIEDISRGGALLSNVNLQDRTIPVDPFRILLEVNTSPLNDWKALCQMVRLQVLGSATAAVQYLKISKEDTQKITQLQTV